MALLLSVSAAVHPAAGQEISNRGALTGIVVAMSDDAPLGLARVTLTPQPTGILLAQSGESSYLLASRSVMTDEKGTYRFADMAPGSYRLYVRRIGYRPVSLDLELEGSQGLQLSVGLTVAPIRLEPFTATVAPADVFSAPEKTNDPVGFDRVSRVRWRQDTFLESDVRMISGEEVVEAITLGETDVLRAMHRLPGVTTRDDWTAEPWVRGAPGSQTRVYFDGLPLFNPVHAGGLGAAINSDALGAVFLHPGVRPPDMGPGAAAVIDMKSRAAGGLGELRGRVGISSSHLSATFDKRWNDGKVGTLVSARRSWLNNTRDLVQNPNGLSPEIPNDYADFVGRLDVDLGGGKSLEVSGLWERDWIDGPIRGGAQGNTSAWGSLASRATIAHPTAGGFMRHTIGFSSFTARVKQIEPKWPLALFDSLPTQEPTDNEVYYLTLNGDWTFPDENNFGPKWRVGYKLFYEEVSYRGAPPTPFSTPVYLFTAEVNGIVSGANLWGERWFRPGDRWTIRLGLRVGLDKETLSGLVDEDRTAITDQQLAPQITVRYQANDRLHFTAAMGSHKQYEQGLAASGLSFGPGLNTSPIWVLPPNTRSAANSEITTLGAEYWIGDAWLASANLYERKTNNVAIPDPGPGTTDDDAFSVSAVNLAQGLELSVRRLAGRWTGAFGYTLAQSVYELGNMRFPAPTDRRHIIDATAITEVPRRIGGGTVRIGGTFTAASGAPYTRIHPGIYDCSNYEPGGGCEAIIPTSVEAPGAERAPWYSAFNVLIDWGRSFNGWHLAAHVQVQNLLNTPRAVTYSVDTAACRLRSLDQPACGAAEDAFLPGLRRHYELGLKVAF